MRIIGLMPFLMAVVLIGGTIHAAPEVTANDLIQKAHDYDNQTVVISGEAFGDTMIRGEAGWVNILSEGTGIGIWASASQLQQIANLGSYARKGDTVQVTGVFHRACPEHGGDVDIHAVSVSVVEVGHPLIYPLDRSKLRWALVLLPITMVGALVTLMKSRSRKSPT